MHRRHIDIQKVIYTSRTFFFDVHIGQNSTKIVKMVHIFFIFLLKKTSVHINIKTKKKTYRDGNITGIKTHNVQKKIGNVNILEKKYSKTGCSYFPPTFLTLFRPFFKLFLHFSFFHWYFYKNKYIK